MFALQPELKVFAGSANRDLAERICKYIGVPLGQATISSFPDGETYVRIEENIRGHDIFIVQPTSPPTNQHLMELLIMVDAARRASADRIGRPGLFPHNPAFNIGPAYRRLETVRTGGVLNLPRFSRGQSQGSLQ